MEEENAVWLFAISTVKEGLFCCFRGFRGALEIVGLADRKTRCTLTLDLTTVNFTPELSDTRRCTVRKTRRDTHRSFRLCVPKTDQMQQNNERFLIVPHRSYRTTTSLSRADPLNSAQPSTCTRRRSP